MFSIANSALKDNSVVKLPGPAMSGNANGNTEAVMAPEPSSLYNVIPRIISKAIKKITKAPATAKELTSMPIRLSKLFPINKKHNHNHTSNY